jgi:hypothetical protein
VARRVIFYIGEALVLTIPVGLGLFLAARAEYRFSPFRGVMLTRWLLGIFLMLCVVDTVLGERYGPALIPQYYVAALVLLAGASLRTMRGLSGCPLRLHRDDGVYAGRFAGRKPGRDATDDGKHG